MAAGDFINPEVYADLAQAEFLKKVKLLGSPAVIEDDTLAGQPGETIHFPKWGALGELDDLQTGVAMTPVELEQIDSSATIKEAGKAVVINDRDKLTMLGGQGGAQSEALRQFAVLAARKVDGDLITEATTNAGHTTYAGAASEFSWATLAAFGFAPFGDEFEPDEFAGIYINSAQLAQAFADEQFISAAKLGDNSVVRRGVIGVLGGVPVYVTDRVTAGEFLVAKQRTLGALYKRRPLVEQDRDVLARQDVVTTNVHYAVKAVTPSGLNVVKLEAEPAG